MQEETTGGSGVISTGGEAPASMEYLAHEIEARKVAAEMRRLDDRDAQDIRTIAAMTRRGLRNRKERRHCGALLRRVQRRLKVDLLTVLRHV